MLLWILCLALVLFLDLCLSLPFTASYPVSRTALLYNHVLNISVNKYLPCLSTYLAFFLVIFFLEFLFVVYMLVLNVIMLTLLDYLLQQWRELSQNSVFLKWFEVKFRCVPGEGGQLLKEEHNIGGVQMKSYDCFYAGWLKYTENKGRAVSHCGVTNMENRKLRMNQFVLVYNFTIISF